MKRFERGVTFVLVLSPLGCVGGASQTTDATNEATESPTAADTGDSAGSTDGGGDDSTATDDGTTTPPVTCEMCGGDVCVDLQASVEHCGACDSPCPAGIACIEGVCACPAGTEACGGACVDVTSDGDNCGACGRACEADLLCNAGTCSSDCGALTQCGGGCVDTTANPLHCGACDSPCPAGNACVASECACAGEPASYAADVEPIFVATCTGAGCHGFPAAQEGLDLRAGEGWAALVDVAASQCGDRMLVDPGNPDGSYLIDKLQGVDMCFGTQMPKMGSLSAAEIDLVSRWICHGAAP